jgi:hypothetical protein
VISNGPAAAPAPRCRPAQQQLHGPHDLACERVAAIGEQVVVAARVQRHGPRRVRAKAVGMPRGMSLVQYEYEQGEVAASTSRTALGRSLL